MRIERVAPALGPVVAAAAVAASLGGFDELAAGATATYLAVLAGAGVAAALLAEPAIDDTGWDAALPLLSIAVSLALTAVVAQPLLWAGHFDGTALVVLVAVAAEAVRRVLVRAVAQPARAPAEARP